MDKHHKRKSSISILPSFCLSPLILLCPLFLALSSGAAEDVMDFDYFRNNWNVIGLKDYIHGSRITPNNELLLSGKTPVQIRLGRDRVALRREQGKLAMNGWMPIILVQADHGPIRYTVTYWATPLPDAKDWRKAFDWPTETENFLCWITVQAINTSDAPAEAFVELGPTSVSTVPKGFVEQQAETATDKKHTREYKWSWNLDPQKTARGVARYTYFPIDNPKTYDTEDAEVWLERTRVFWTNILTERTAQIEVPCRKAREALLAAHVCQMIANDHGEVHGGEDFYDAFYIRDGAYQVMELEEAGLHDTALNAVKLYLDRQRPDGRFESQAGQFDANGQAVWVLWQYYKMTADRAWLTQVYPNMRRAVDWTIKARRQAPADSPYAGVLPNAPADGEYLWAGKHHIVGYDFWNLRGVLCTADAARILGKTDEAAELLMEAALYREAIDAAWKKTELAHFPPSWEKAGTHWGNTETLWPTPIFDPDDPRVAALSDHVRKDFAGGFIEGTIQWHGHAAAIHPYMGAYTTMADLIRGNDEQVVKDFYWYLLHSTAAHAFPEGIYYEKRYAWSDTIPHVTGACNYAIMLRHMLVHEQGNELHLLKAVPDWWLDDGEEIRLERLPTHFGEMAMTVCGADQGVKIELDRPTRQTPTKIVLHLPTSRPLVGKLDGIEVVTRADQKKRWDFPTVVSLYKQHGVPAESPHPNTDWFKNAQIGVFMHFLPADAQELARVDDFDVDALAQQLEAVGANYFVLTLGQNSGFMNSPNPTYNRYTGYVPGERCSQRDLPLDVYRALSPKGIKLMLYLPCQVPYSDARAQKAFGLPPGEKNHDIDIAFAKKWADVIHDWSSRYGDKVAGWWFDGGYEWIGFNNDIARLYADAVKRANPNALVTFNPGVKLIRWTAAEDYTAGELAEPFEYVPTDRWVEGSRWHALTFLGASWGKRDTRYPTERWAQWVTKVLKKGGVITLDVGPNWNPDDGPIGTIGQPQMAQLREVRDAIDELRATK